MLTYKENYILSTLLCLLLILPTLAFSQSCPGGLRIKVPGSDSKLELSQTANIDEVKCTNGNTGNIDINVSGGNNNYTYQWSTGATTEDLNGISTGSYSVTITDESDCTASMSVDVDYLTPSQSDIASQSSCGNCLLNDGYNTYFYNPNSEYIGSISDEEMNGVALGHTDICVELDATVQSCDDIPYLPRHWKVNVDKDDDDVCVKLYFTEEELISLLDASKFSDVDSLLDNLCVTAFDGRDESCDNHIDARVYSENEGLLFNPNDPIAGIWSLELCVAKLTNFYLHTCNTQDKRVLPVELMDFMGYNQGEINYLTWKTATELNTSHFEIERSDDGVNFEYIGQVKAFGTTSEMQYYSYDDIHPINGKNYYRLRIVDFDGTYEYSKTILLFTERKEGFIKAFPNPFIDRFILELNGELDGNATVEIYDVLGRKVKVERIFIENKVTITPIRMKGFSEGTYFVKIQFDDYRSSYQTLKIKKKG